MPWTNYPNGVSLTTTTGTVNGHLNATTGSFSGLLTVGTVSVSGNIISGGTVVGDIWTMTVAFSTASTAQTVVAGSPPDWATDLVGAFVTMGSVSAVVAAYTVRGGSAGTVHVSSENNGAGLINYGKDAGLTIDTATVGTASGIQCVRGVQGTAGDSYLTLVFRRTAV